VAHARKNCQSLSHFTGSKGDPTAAKHRSDSSGVGWIGNPPYLVNLKKLISKHMTWIINNSILFFQ